MADSKLVLSTTSGRIATITLNRPQTLNALSLATCADLNRALAAAAADSEVAVVILTGAGRAFSSGVDLSEGLGASESIEERLNRVFRPGIDTIMDMPQPVIVALNGPVVGVGCAYPLAADLVVMSQDAYMQQPFIDIGLIPDGGVTWQLLHRLGHKWAFEYIVFAERVPAQRCQDLGLVNCLAPTDGVMAQAMQWANLLLHKAPLAMRYSKQALRRNLGVSFDQAFATEVALQQRCGDTQDFKEGVAAFREKRPARFRGI